MIGQDKLINQIKQFNIDTFPRSSILVGESGCGKHLLASIIGEHLKLDTIKLDIIDDSSLESLYLSPNPYIYLVEGNDLTIKQQNTILKTLEEPLKNSFIIILVEDLSYLLPTITNRCCIFKFEEYQDKTLKEFVPPKYADQEETMFILRTPGKLNAISTINFNEYLEFGSKMVSKLKIASLANALTIADKFNYKEDYKKFNISLMLDVLQYISYKDYLSTKNKDSLTFYNCTIKYKKDLSHSIYDKKQLMISYIINLWESLRGE